MSRIVDIEPLLKKYDGMNEGTEFSPIHFINDLMALEQQHILDKIRAEIKSEYKVESEHPYGNGLKRAIDIVDKYIEGSESE